MMYVLIPIYVIVCVFLILVVLLQQGKGADVASAFGAASSQTTFGARGATTVFERITTWSFVAFSVLAIAISLLQSHPRSSVLKTQTAKRPAMPAPSLPNGAAPKPAAPAPAQPAAPPAAQAPAPATK
ncbi:MAG TPA: preprotein translocase subunit SecG [Thermoanaerobaculia bacterium]|nr:preprotein translocase subunit SecG [Thermoanaerobaculia bacterium]